MNDLTKIEEQSPKPQSNQNRKFSSAEQDFRPKVCSPASDLYDIFAANARNGIGKNKIKKEEAREYYYYYYYMTS